jgi:hypothetical protein
VDVGRATARSERRRVECDRPPAAIDTVATTHKTDLRPPIAPPLPPELHDSGSALYRLGRFDRALPGIRFRTPLPGATVWRNVRCRR